MKQLRDMVESIESLIESGYAKDADSAIKMAVLYAEVEKAELLEKMCDKLDAILTKLLPS